MGNALARSGWHRRRAEKLNWRYAALPRLSVMKTFKDLKAELLQNPEFRAEYERLRPEFELAKTIIAARAAQGLTQAELAARMNTSQA